MRRAATWARARIHTLPELQRANRKLDRQRQAVAGFLGAMKAGATLHQQHGPTRPWWILSTGWIVPDEIAAVLTNHASVVAVGDALFPGMSQTWQFIEPMEDFQ